MSGGRGEGAIQDARHLQTARGEDLLVDIGFLPSHSSHVIKAAQKTHGKDKVSTWK